VRQWVWCVGGVVLGLMVVGAGVVAYVVRHAEPILRKRVIASLEERFDSPVDLDALHISVVQGLEVTGEGLKVVYLGDLDKTRTWDEPAMLTVRRFTFRTGLRELFEPTMRVKLVRVEGMTLRIPPKQDRSPMLPKGQHKAGRWKIVVDEIAVSDMTLNIETNKPGKAPLEFDIGDVTMHDVGPGRAMPFDARLVNAKPVGEIHSTGEFGPWDEEEPRDTPVAGDYSFTNADLGTIKGIGGTLSSTGRYGGTLGEIGVTGETDTPDFSLDVSEHPVDLKTEFDATVDGTSGDTRLNAVHATLRGTVLEVKGLVRRASDVEVAGAMPQKGPEDVSGHFIDISVVSDKARVEDILTLAARTSPPLMQGAMTLKARLEIPPGQVSISKKIRVQGTFAIRGARFSNAKWQQTVDNLSMRASGNLKEAQAGDVARVDSSMGGRFALAGAMLQVSGLHYEMPGAQVDLAGKYGLDGQTFDFAGTVKTKATASAMLTGWKSWVAKPFDPLLKRDGAGLEVPITISGTKADPKLGLDLGKLAGEVFSRGKKKDGGAGDAQGPKP
jgi:hypothetical protein